MKYCAYQNSTNFQLVNSPPKEEINANERCFRITFISIVLEPHLFV